MGEYEVGETVLFRADRLDILEGKILQISSSKKFFKMNHIDRGCGRHIWIKNDQIVEVLEECKE